MVGLFTIIAVGFLLGMRHATDPDHVIAVSTIVTREHSLKRSALIGAAWGIGHTMTILAVGGAIILFRVNLPPRLGLAMELAVAVMLILLGLRNVGGLFTWTTKAVMGPERQMDQERPHYHSHGDFIHSHQHSQPGGHPHDPHRNPVSRLDRWFAGYQPYQLMRPLLIGIVHGLAGSAAIALLVLSTIPSARWAVAYLAVFGIGTVLGMTLITLTIGGTMSFGQRRFVNVSRHFALAAGLISLAFGVFIAYEIGFVNGLFTGHVHWIPR